MVEWWAMVSGGYFGYVAVCVVVCATFEFFMKRERGSSWARKAFGGGLGCWVFLVSWVSLGDWFFSESWASFAIGCIWDFWRMGRACSFGST